MVLTSVYLSVSTSLPSTSNIKPVEVWLLFNLAYPFLVILVNVVIQVAIAKYFTTKKLFSELGSRTPGKRQSEKGEIEW